MHTKPPKKFYDIALIVGALFLLRYPHPTANFYQSVDADDQFSGPLTPRFAGLTNQQ